jgi:hypothetical protein
LLNWGFYCLGFPSTQKLGPLKKLPCFLHAKWEFHFVESCIMSWNDNEVYFWSSNSLNGVELGLLAQWNMDMGFCLVGMQFVWVVGFSILESQLGSNILIGGCLTLWIECWFGSPCHIDHVMSRFLIHNSLTVNITQKQKATN